MKVIFIIWCLPIMIPMLLIATILSVFGHDEMLDSILDVWE